MQRISQRAKIIFRMQYMNNSLSSFTCSILRLLDCLLSRWIATALVRSTAHSIAQSVDASVALLPKNPIARSLDRLITRPLARSLDRKIAGAVAHSLARLLLALCSHAYPINRSVWRGRGLGRGCQLTFTWVQKLMTFMYNLVFRINVQCLLPLSESWCVSTGLELWRRLILQGRLLAFPSVVVLD